MMFLSESTKMSIFPSPFLAKLQDLKLWQGNYEALLQNKSSEMNNPSDFETIEGISALDSTRSSPNMTEKQFNTPRNVEWDKKVVTPSKPFAQLLEEKLAEDQPVVTPVKPKKAFLRKGSGLVRFRMTYPQNKMKLNSKSSHETIASNKTHSNSQSKVVSPRHENCFKSRAANSEIPSMSLRNVDLRMPDINIKPKGVWVKVQQNNHNIVQQTMKSCHEAEEENRDNLDDLMKRMNQIGLINFPPSHPSKNECSNALPEKPHRGQLDRNYKNATLENTERELRVFEELEERAEHSSFSSTNSSIIGILSSTPSKKKQNIQVGEVIPEELDDHYPAQNNNDVYQHIKTNKIQDDNRKQHLLHNFLSNLKHMVKQREEETTSKQLLTRSNKILSPDTTFSEPESNTETRSPTSSSFYTDFENTFKGGTRDRNDVAVNTSFSLQEENTQISTECQNCEELRQQLKKMANETPDIKAEKARVCDFAKDLEKKRDQLNNEMQKMKKKYEKDIEDLKIEIENEKKKFHREKSVFDKYMKESVNRPNKKEREELSLLKKELTDIKELMKLKETKNGATQARLRNQIKSLEKERDELKSTVDNLQKENSKLNASRRLERPSEVKMLQEINKNLTKLTEETFKKQTTKTDQGTLVLEKKIIKKGSVNDDDYPYENEENEGFSQLKRKSSSRTRKSMAKQNASSDIDLTNTKDFTNISLEKQYETTFGQFSTSTSKDNNSLNDSKREKVETVFPDGSKEVKYSNGNTKIVSPDGNCITVRYYNGDIKEMNVRKNIIKYFYSENCTWHTQYGDGSELLEYANGQKEKKYKDGKKEITLADGTLVTKYPDGNEEIVYVDNSKMIKTNEGEKILVLPNGQKEFHTKDHKRREYPDGTVKILYLDGTQETRYASGRIRIKDPNGALIMDSNGS